jgi:hypothetical protein
MGTHNTTQMALLSGTWEQHKSIVRRSEVRAHWRVTYGRRFPPLEGGETGSAVGASQSVALVTGEPASPIHSLSVTLYLTIQWSFKDWITTESFTL